MPELPEVETMVRGVRPHVVGRTLERLEACPNRCRPLTLNPALDLQIRRSRGRRIVAVRRRAKRIVLDLDDSSAFVIEPRMTGLLLLADPPNLSHLRLRWQFTDAGEYPAVWFWDRRGLGTVSLLAGADLERVLGPENLGPDALEMTSADWVSLCRGTRREIKVALLDQKGIAGIGNLYASEILHRAALAPTRRAHTLRSAEIEALANCTREVLHQAILHEGSTLSDGTYRNALNQSGGYQNAHQVYDREGEPCPRCGAAVRRIVQAQRATFFCPDCQRSPRRRRLHVPH